MQRLERPASALMMLAIGLALLAASPGYAQALWKYTDKDGKVTYSDKAPKKGENAQPVNSDPAANVIDAPKNAPQGVSQKTPEMKIRDDERDKQRSRLLNAVDLAKTELATAQAALEAGREPLQSEIQIVVGRGPAGAPTGTNQVIRKQEYYARIAALEEAVKKAEEKVETAERDLRRNAP